MLYYTSDEEYYEDVWEDFIESERKKARLEGLPDPWERFLEEVKDDSPPYRCYNSAGSGGPEHPQEGKRNEEPEGR